MTMNDYEMSMRWSQGRPLHSNHESGWFIEKVRGERISHVNFFESGGGRFLLYKVSIIPWSYQVSMIYSPKTSLTSLVPYFTCPLLPYLFNKIASISLQWLLLVSVVPLARSRYLQYRFPVLDSLRQKKCY